jgi:hypothetical protein
MRFGLTCKARLDLEEARETRGFAICTVVLYKAPPPRRELPRDVISNHALRRRTSEHCAFASRPFPTSNVFAVEGSKDRCTRPTPSRCRHAETTLLAPNVDGPGALCALRVGFRRVLATPLPYRHAPTIYSTARPWSTTGHVALATVSPLGRLRQDSTLACFVARLCAKCAYLNPTLDSSARLPKTTPQLAADQRKVRGNERLIARPSSTILRHRRKVRT